MGLSFLHQFSIPNFHIYLQTTFHSFRRSVFNKIKLSHNHYLPNPLLTPSFRHLKPLTTQPASMQLTTFIITLFAATALATTEQPLKRSLVFPRQVNSGRPVATGACCIANTSKKQDVCTKADGTSGKCAPANTAGCEYLLSFSFRPFKVVEGWLMKCIVGGAQLTCV
jgi:hypothetical protein